MKILVTGGLGFIGSNFILKILQQNTSYEIINVDDELSGSHKENLLSIQKNPNYNFVKGNITNKRLMNDLVNDCDVVINFAAESFVDKSISDANPFLVSNIRGAYTILDLITKHNKKMIHISTDEVFGSLETSSATEEEKFNPSNPYAATKASAELIINSFISTHDSDVVITRCTNNYGPRQFPEKLIPKTILLANNNQKIPVYGDGKNIRDWIFVEDHCNAINEILIKGKSRTSYNISGNNEISNLEIVTKILDIMGKSHNLIDFVEDRPGHDYRYSLDSTKIQTELKWSSNVNFDEGLKITVDWYLNNSNWIDSISKKVLNSTPWKN